MRKLTFVAVACMVLALSGATQAAPLLDAQVGGGQTSSYSEAGGVYTIQGSGGDIWGQNDAFHFVYQEFAWDQPLTLTAQVGVQDGFQAITGGIDGWAKAGLMIRQSLATNSRNAMAVIAHSDGNGLNPQIRKQDNNNTDGTTHTGSRINRDVPVWLRLEYAGDGHSFKTYWSDDGAAWNQWSNDANMQLNTDFDGPILAGLAVTAHNNNNLTQVRFSDVEG